MARRSKTTLFEDLIALPWWISIILAAVSYIMIRIIAGEPSTGTVPVQDIAMYSLRQGIGQFGPFISLFFLITAAISGCITVFNSGNQRSESMTRRRRTVYISSEPASRQSEIPAISYRNGVDPSPLSHAIPASEVTIIPDDAISLDTLRKIEWFSFELFCKVYFETVGHAVQRTSCGADGGIDLLLFDSGSTQPTTVVQCKTRVKKDIGVQYIRELLGVMTASKVSKGILITNSSFTHEATRFAQSNAIELIDIHSLHRRISELSPFQRRNLYMMLNRMDYTTPTCPNCETKLVLRTASKGSTAGQRFWGCSNYPRCRYVMKVSS